MSKERYIKRIQYLRQKDKVIKLLAFLYKYLPALIIVAYPVMLITKAVLGFDLDLLLMILVPAGTLLIITVMRKLIDRERPYIKYKTKPLIPKEKKGESFPSRHTASAFIIAMSAFALSSTLAFVLLGIAALIAMTRILAGVHFISDVLAGMVISTGLGFIFFILI